MKSIHWLLLTLCLLLFFGCAESSREIDGSGGGDGDSDSDSDSDSDADTDGNSDNGCTMMDILFLIDDSGSMGCEQEMLANAFPGFIQVLEQYSNENTDEISYRIGVTSTGRDLNFTLGSYPQNLDGLDGHLVSTPSGAQKWLDGPGNSAQLETDFSTMAQLGTDGPFYEMPLECLARALEKDSPGGLNEGFLRPGALFIAVIITDEDDCSRTDDGFTIMNDQCWTDPSAHNLVDLDNYKSKLDARFGGPSGYVVVAIAGEEYCTADSYPTDCGGSDMQAGALDAQRLEEFVVNKIGGSGGYSLFADICTYDMPQALAETLDKVEAACDDYVIE